MKNFFRCIALYVIPQIIVFSFYELLFIDANGMETGANGYEVFMDIFPLVSSVLIGIFVFRFSGQYEHCDKRNYRHAGVYFTKKYISIIITLLLIYFINMEENYIWYIVDSFTAVDLFIDGAIPKIPVTTRYIYYALINQFSLLSYILMYISYCLSKSFSMAQKNNPTLAVCVQ